MLTPGLPAIIAPGVKGTVYGGIVRFPNHPDANMHGELRCIIRTRLFTQAIVALARYGVEVLPRDLGRNWTESESHIEHLVTLPHYGEVWACPISLAYLSVSAYAPIPDTLLLSNTKKVTE